MSRLPAIYSLVVCQKFLLVYTYSSRDGDLKSYSREKESTALGVFTGRDYREHQ